MTLPTDTVDLDPPALADGEPLADLVVHPAADTESTARPAPAEVLDRLERARRSFGGLLQVEEPDAAWLADLRGQLDGFRQFCASCPDETLYYLLYFSGHETEHYSVLHAMLCTAIAQLAAHWLGWAESETDALVASALTMNIAMTSLQDALAAREADPTTSHRESIREHASRGRLMLEQAGVTDALWLETVQNHHAAPSNQDVEQMTPTARLAQLLRRIDVYTAKLSRRKRRAATTSALAARDAFLDSAGRPDAFGATLLRVLGLYPPGTWVELVNGDFALVVARGDKAHAPRVAAIRRVDGGVYLNPLARDTSVRAFAVVRGLNNLTARVQVSHAKVLGL